MFDWIKKFFKTPSSSACGHSVYPLSPQAVSLGVDCTVERGQLLREHVKIWSGIKYEPPSFTPKKLTAGEKVINRLADGRRKKRCTFVKETTGNQNIAIGVNACATGDNYWDAHLITNIMLQNEINAAANRIAENQRAMLIDRMISAAFRRK